MRLTPSDVSKLAEQAKVRRDLRAANELAEAERRRLEVQLVEERLQKEQARLEEGLKAQARKTLLAALEGKQSIALRGEIFNLQNLKRRGFNIYFRRPLRSEELIKREADILDLESEIKNLYSGIASSIEAWTKGIFCQSESVFEYHPQEIQNEIEAGVYAYIDMATGTSDFYERSDGHEIYSDDYPNDFLKFINPDVFMRIPQDVEWKNLNPEVPRIRRAIDGLVLRRPEIKTKILSHRKQIQDGILIDRAIGGSSQIYEISWENRRISENWGNRQIDNADGHQWISGVCGQKIMGLIDESIRKVIDGARLNSLKLSVTLKSQGGFQLSIVDGSGLGNGGVCYESPPADVLAELLALLGWIVEVESPGNSESLISLSW